MDAYLGTIHQFVIMTFYKSRIWIRKNNIYSRKYHYLLVNEESPSTWRSAVYGTMSHDRVLLLFLNMLKSVHLTTST